MNHCIALALITVCDFKENMPVMQLFALSANMPAVALDHDYLEPTQQDEFLQREKVYQVNFA